MKRKNGRRHPLLIYRRAMSRIATLAAMVGIFCVVFYFLPWFGIIPLLPYESMLLLMVAAVLAFAMWLFALIAPRLAYVQARENAIAFVTPFIRMNISYRRVQSSRPMSVSLLFPKDQLGWGQRQFLEPFFGTTALVLQLRGLPVSKALLRLFLPPAMYTTGEDGLLLIVSDWMSLSTEIDSMHSLWHQRVKDSKVPPPLGFGILKKNKKR